MKSVTLQSGAAMPLNGFGTWKASAEETESAVIAAVEAGYKHIDCAPLYLNEDHVGNALSKVFARGQVKRDQLFVTSKLWNTCHKKEHVVQACRQSLEHLQLDYLDLYLVHHPYSWKFLGLPITEQTVMSHDSNGLIELGGASLLETWRGLEECVHLGLVRDIGVSNYSAALLVDVINFAQIKPSVNQCETHVYNTRPELRSVCDMFDIHFTMYAILGSGKEGPLADETVATLAKQHDATPAQILIAWGLSQKCSVLAKSTQPSRIVQNLASENVILSDEDVKMLNALDRKQIVCNAVEYWGFPSHA